MLTAVDQRIYMGVGVGVEVEKQVSTSASASPSVSVSVSASVSASALCLWCAYLERDVASARSCTDKVQEAPRGFFLGSPPRVSKADGLYERTSQPAWLQERPTGAE